MQVERVLVPRRNQVLLETIEIPALPGPDQITVETDYTFISAGTELANFTGLDRSVDIPGSWCAYPWAAGYANVGRVVARGAAVEGFEIGQRVFSSSRHQQIQHLRVADHRTDMLSLLATVPEDLDGAVAAACMMPLIAMSALSNSRWRLNDRVGVWGLGMVGNLAAQLYQLAGCRVLGIDPDRRRRELARSVGIEAVAGPESDQLRAAMEELGAADGLDIAVDAVGEAAVVDSAHRFVRDFGQLVLLGSPRREHVADLTPLMRSVKLRGLKLRGSLQSLVPLRPQAGAEESISRNLVTVFDLAARGRLQIQPLISHRLPPQQIERAYRGLLQQKDVYIGVALTWNRRSG